MKKNILFFRSLGGLVLNVACLLSCAFANISIANVSQNTEAKGALMSLDPCEKARAIENDLILRYGEPDFTCTTSYVKGVIVKVWCCVEEKRIVYYSFGHEHGCGDSGYEVYSCGSTELPLSVKNEIAYAGEGNECWVLMNERENPCHK